MFALVPFEAAHVRLLDNYAGQERLVASVSDGDLETLAKAGPCWTGMLGDRVLGCAGFVRMNQWRCQAWALLQRTGPRDFIHVHRAVRHIFETCEFRRIETYVNPRHPAGMRWARMLGFELEQAYIPYFFPDGSGASYWAWRK